MEYQPGNQTGSTSNGVFYVGNYTKDQDVVLEFHHKNEIRTVLEISIPKGTQKYLLTAEDMKSLTEGEEYSYCIRQAGIAMQSCFEASRESRKVLKRQVFL